MMIASAQRQNDRTTVHRVEVVCQRAVPCDSQASVAIFPRWKSRFARSSGYLPERDGRHAPPLNGGSLTTSATPAAPDRTVQRDPPAADAA